MPSATATSRVGFGLLALLVAVVLGGLHAMAPGHGKTMMAAYVVGRRGTPRQVAAIGLTVAVTHTGGVLALGTVIWLSQAIAPDRVLPWLTVASGGLLASCGLALLYRRVVLGRTGHSHLRLPGLATTTTTTTARTTSTPTTTSTRTTTTTTTSTTITITRTTMATAITARTTGTPRTPSAGDGSSSWAWLAGWCPRPRRWSCCSAPSPSTGRGSASCSSASTASAWPAC